MYYCIQGEVVHHLMHCNGGVMRSSQGENQASVLHVQPHVWRNSEGEPDDAGSGFLRLGGFLVHQANQVPQHHLTEWGTLLPRATFRFWAFAFIQRELQRENLPILI